eukprot:Sspe_Gene.83121::Locus_54520_Transcript_1_1_Confidence_1.000_Length_1114::g.83121::m.83121
MADRDECWRRQVAEVEALSAVYDLDLDPEGLNPDEPPKAKDTRFTVVLSGSTVTVTLPHDYPSAVPNVRINGAPPVGEARRVVHEVESGSECLFDLLTSLEDLLATAPATATPQEPEPVPDPTTLRVGVYCHHIKAEKKRKYIADGSRTHGLTGCYKFGQPGFIFVEGEKEVAAGFIAELKRMPWKSFIVRIQEEDKSGERRFA